MWPDWCKRETLARRLDIEPGAVDQYVKRGVIPPALCSQSRCNQAMRLKSMQQVFSRGAERFESIWGTCKHGSFSVVTLPRPRRSATRPE